MDYQILEEQFQRGAQVIRKIREDRLELLRDAHERTGEQSLIDDWEDLGTAEDTTKREYSGRFLFELLQNANDAIRDWMELNPDEDGRTGSVQIILSRESLIVANQGAPFSEQNVKAICRLGKSTKSLSKSIGHKGVGFKSVLEITDRPEIYSGDFAFGFSLAECARTIQEVLEDNSLTDIAMPIHRFPFHRSLTEVNDEDRTLVCELFTQGYVTVVRLPLIVSDAAIEEQIHRDLNSLTLLFLSAINKLEATFPSGHKLTLQRDPLEKNGDVKQVSRKITLTEIDVTSSSSNWLVIAPHQPIAIENLALITDLGKAWKEVTHVSFSLAFPFSSDWKLRIEDEAFPFYVYFPTKENSGFRFVVNADFYVGSSRTHIPRNDFNIWLAKQIVEYLATCGINGIKQLLPNEPDIVNLLAPCNVPQDEFDREFYNLYLDRIRTVDFVPAGSDTYLTPDNLRFVPEGAEIEAFHNYFPEEQLTVGCAWCYPQVSIEESENQRVKQGHPFLFQIGAKRLEVDDVLQLLTNGPAIPISVCQNFMAFVARWWQSLPLDRRPVFLQKMSTVAIVPTLMGWHMPPKDGTLIFQASLRQDAPDVPRGFDFETVTSEAYDEEGRNSQEFLFLRSLGVIDYDARSIALRAILPAFENPDRFCQLSPESIKNAYEFLKQNRPTMDSRQGSILVPACRPGDEQIVWRPAKDLYFGHYWTGNDDLEIIYGSFDDVYFLGALDFLGNLAEEANQDWQDFFAWLGVQKQPRLVSKSSFESGHTLKTSATFCNPDFSNHGRWTIYLEKNWEQFICTNPNHKHATFRFTEVHTIYKLEDILATQDREVLQRLFRVLAAYWRETYYPKSSTQIQCSRTSCSQPRRSLTNYFVFVLQTANWIPALTRETEARELLRPSEVWTLGQAEPQAVQRMVPILPPLLQQSEFSLFQSDLKFMDSSKASFEDYLALLQRLPELYPLEWPDLEGDALTRWRDDIRTVFNWICRVLQNILIRGDLKLPVRPDHLKVLAFKNNGAPCYIEVDDKRLVYPDDNYLEERWADICYYLRVDEDWRRLRNWFGISDLSDVVQAQPEPSPDLIQETDRVQDCFKNVLPFFLTLIEKSQPSRLDDLVSRLKRLKCHVVEELWIRQSLKETDAEPKRYPEDIYLQIDAVPGPHAGNVRIGNLYIKRSALENYDLWGRPIAAYVEIERLAEPLILLLERDTAMRWQYLRGVKGVTEADYSRMQGKLGESDQSPIDEGIEKKLLDVLQKRIESRPEDSTPVNGDVPPPEGDGEIPSKEESKPKKEEFILPPLEAITVEGYDYRGDGEAIDSKHKGHSHGHGKGGPVDWETIEANKRMIGKRGEEIVFEIYEPNRLRSLGYSDEAISHVLKWISKDNETANRDLESVDEEGNPIVIEVKSSASEDPNFEMSVEEFRKAVACGDSYYLYRVFNISTTQPYVCRYRNPNKLLQEKKITVDVKQFTLSLPRVVKPDHISGETETNVIEQ